MIEITEDIYRPLTNQEIGQLVLQGCQCENWNDIQVTTDFQPEHIHQSRFSGKIKLGSFHESITLFGGITFHTGIYNATIHNCIIGNNVFIRNVKSYMANYIVEDGVKIENIKTLATEGPSSFGNGILVNVINEGGGRAIPIYDYLSSHVAYMLALYRHDSKLISRLEEMIKNYTKSIRSNYGTIGRGATIINCNIIKNVKIGPYAVLEGTGKLSNGSINSSAAAPVFVGDSVIMKNFILCSGSRINDATLLSDTFIGQGCNLDKHYSAEHSVFFANCQGHHGEACSIFAGPYTVTHHKSTLLIAGLYSFLNAGSGSNQSNHLYKLGPIHQGIVERGAKTTSDSYLLWPGKIGAFSLVMGRHYRHSDTTDFPFSYLIENKDESVLVPAINLSSIGTVRDSQKWPKRDKRKDPNKLDHINFNLLSPYTVQKMLSGRDTLLKLKSDSTNNHGNYLHEGLVITASGLERGINLYEMAIEKFLGNSFISRIQSKKPGTLQEMRNCLSPDFEIGKGKWIDLAGMFAPQISIINLIESINHAEVNSMEEVDEILTSIHKSYYNYEWTWAYYVIEKYFNISMTGLKIDQAIDLVNTWKTAVLEIDKRLLNDAEKEFAGHKKIGFGIDGDEEIKETDFKSVRNHQKEASSTMTSIREHMKKKTELGDSIITLLKNLK